MSKTFNFCLNLVFGQLIGLFINKTYKTRCKYWHSSQTSVRRVYLSEGCQTIVNWLLALFVHETRVGPAKLYLRFDLVVVVMSLVVLPGVVTVMCQGEGPGAQAVIHPQDRQAGPYRVARLNGDDTGHAARLV